MRLWGWGLGQRCLVLGPVESEAENVTWAWWAGCDIQLRRRPWEWGNARRAWSPFSADSTVAEASLAKAASDGPLQPQRREETLPQGSGAVAGHRWGCATSGCHASVGARVSGEVVDQTVLWDFPLDLPENSQSWIGMFWSGSVNGARGEQCCVGKPSVFSDIPVPSA